MPHLFVDIAHTAPVAHEPSRVRDSLALEQTLVVPLGEKFSLQFEMIEPLNGGEILGRAAFAFQLF